MQLQKLSVEDRSFLIQMNEIEREFKNHIPWFNKIKDLKYFTDTDELKPKILETLQLDPSVQIDPYILTADTRWKEYVWSILNFSSSPECFLDPNNEIIRQQLDSEKYTYLSCLQIRDVFRTWRVGVELLSKTLHQIFQTIPKVQCVVADERLLSYYKYFGGEIVNEMVNKDHLYIMTCDQKDFIKRH